MPNGYAGEGKTYLKKLDKWVKKDTEKAFDYGDVNKESVAMLVNFFRWYPDYFCDIFRDENAKYKLELPQRLIMRIFARYRNTYITGVRGLTKTYLAILSSLVEGILFPGHKVRYCAPNQKQAAQLAKAAFREIEKSYPIITAMWNVNNERPDMFRCSTIYGSEISMYAVRGDTASACLGEECGQEGENAFPIEEFLKDIYPIVRDNRMINQKIDTVHINQKHQHIGNACAKTNRAYSELRANCLRDMTQDANRYEGYVVDISWITALLGNLRDIQYFKDLKKTLSAQNWQRECCAIYTGTSENPMIPDETLSRSRKLTAMEDKHCGDPNAIYVVSYDVADEDGQRNAKCGLTVVKLTEFETISKRDKYRAQVVYADSFPPPKTYYQHAVDLKRVWSRYCMDGGQTTYLVIDCQGGHGKSVVEELMKSDTISGTRPLACVDHCYHAEMEQKNALPVIYPMKAGTRGTADPDGDMIDYAQIEFEQGNVELLIPRVLDGIEQYKRNHGIKDALADGKIAIPYKKTEELCGQIMNLQKTVSGMTVKEARKAKSIQRDIWSSLKYALRIKWREEQKLSQKHNKAKSSYADLIAAFGNGQVPTGQIQQPTSERARLLQLRKR